MKPTKYGRCQQSKKPRNARGHCPESDGPEFSHGCYLLPNSRIKRKRK